MKKKTPSVTINISLSDKLRLEAQQLIDQGEFVSFSDLVRTSLRLLLTNRKHDSSPLTSS